jgi:hypothetical protein
MQPQTLMQLLCESLGSHTLIHMEVGTPIHVASDDLPSLRLALIETGNRNDKPLDKAGTPGFSVL